MHLHPVCRAPWRWLPGGPPTPGQEWWQHYHRAWVRCKFANHESLNLVLIMYKPGAASTIVGPLDSIGYFTWCEYLQLPSQYTSTRSLAVSVWHFVQTSYAVFHTERVDRKKNQVSRTTLEGQTKCLKFGCFPYYITEKLPTTSRFSWNDLKFFLYYYMYWCSTLKFCSQYQKN